MRLAARFSEEAYKAAWTVALAAASADFVSTDDPRDDLVTNTITTGELFDEAVENLHPKDFERFLLNIAIREGVTLYEVYLEKAIRELVERKLHGTSVFERSPDWQAVARSYRVILRIDPYPPRVKDVVALRNLLTHRRGELVTDKLRTMYASDDPDPFSAFEVPLTTDIVYVHLDVLAKIAGRVDARVWPLAWGSDDIDHDLHDALLLDAAWLWQVP